LFVHIGGIELDLGTQLMQLRQQRAEVAHVGHALGDDHGVVVVEIEHQHELARDVFTRCEDHTLDVIEADARLFVLFQALGDEDIGIEAQLFGDSVAHTRKRLGFLGVLAGVIVALRGVADRRFVHICVRSSLAAE
jgi:hypothetical protein